MREREGEREGEREREAVGGVTNKHCQNSNKLFTPNMGGPQL